MSIKNIIRNNDGLISFWIEGEHKFSVEYNANGSVNIVTRIHISGKGYTQVFAFSYDVQGLLIGVDSNVEPKLHEATFRELISFINGFKVAAGGNSLDAYGEIKLTVTGADHNPTTTPEQIIGYNKGTSSVGVTGDFANNKNVIHEPGTYDAYVHIVANVDDLETYTIYLAKENGDNVDVDVEIERKTDVLKIVATGFIPGLVGDDTLSLWVSSANGAGALFVPTYINLHIRKVGN